MGEILGAPEAKQEVLESILGALGQKFEVPTEKLVVLEAILGEPVQTWVELEQTPEGLR